MGLLGKILALLNVVAAAAFVVLAGADLARRNDAAYALFRHELVVHGLPLDDLEPDLNEDIKKIDRFSDKIYNDLFQSVGGNFVRFQAEEVKRVKGLTVASVESLGGEVDKRQRLAALMLPLARSPADYAMAAERIGYRANGIKVAEGAPLQDLMEDLNGLFDEVLKTESDGYPKAGGTPTRPTVAQLLPRERREAIAHLLFNVNLADESYPPRLLVVVGVRAFNAEIGKQTTALALLAERERFAMTGDRANFEVEYQARVNDIRVVAEFIDDQNAFLVAQQKLREDNALLVKKREERRNEIKEALNKARADMLQNLTRQNQEEQKLFESQRMLGEMMHELARLEQEIRVLETTKNRRGEANP